MSNWSDKTVWRIAALRLRSLLGNGCSSDELISPGFHGYQAMQLEGHALLMTEARSPIVAYAQLQRSDSQ